jgi:hypothetical protein
MSRPAVKYNPAVSKTLPNGNGNLTFNSQAVAQRGATKNPVTKLVLIDARVDETTVPAQYKLLIKKCFNLSGI